MEQNSIKTTVGWLFDRLDGMHNILINQYALTGFQADFPVIGKKVCLAVVNNNNFQFGMPVPSNTVHVHLVKFNIMYFYRKAACFQRSVRCYVNIGMHVELIGHSPKLL